MTPLNPPTEKQRAYVAALQKQLRIPTPALDIHCRERFGRPSHELTRREMSALLDAMTGWQAMPAALQRAMGQRDLFEVTG